MSDFNMENSPNFFILGFPKSGTTTLYEYCRMHPEILMSAVKEPAFFDKDWFFCEDGTAQTAAWLEYMKNWSEEVGTAVWRGDATPCLVFPEVVKRIKMMCEAQVKFVVVMRDPVRRAYSHYWHGVRVGAEAGDIGTAFDFEGRETPFSDGTWPKYYLLNGRYQIHLDRLVSEFGRSAIHLVKLEQLASDPAPVLKDMWRFLGIDENVGVEKVHSNPSAVPRIKSIQRFMSSTGTAKDIVKRMVPGHILKRVRKLIVESNLRVQKLPEMGDDLTERLSVYYYEDNLNLAEKYQFDISGWCKPDGGTF